MKAEDKRRRLVTAVERKSFCTTAMELRATVGKLGRSRINWSIFCDSASGDRLLHSISLSFNRDTLRPQKT